MGRHETSRAAVRRPRYRLASPATRAMAASCLSRSAGRSSFVSRAARDKVSVKLLLLGVAVAVIVFLATSGHVLFLPLILVLPFGLLFRGGRQRHQRNWNWFGRK